MIDWDSELQTASKRLLSSDTAPNLVESIQYSLLSAGKYFRPRLMEASANLFELPHATFIPFAIALEMIHSFTLIHDDLPCMDDDDFRRGKPSNHKVYGEALALLAGDALVPMAFENCLQSLQHVDPLSWKSAFTRLLDVSGPRGVIGGQALEMLIHKQNSLQKLREMHALKTGALFDAAILIPADLSPIKPSTEQFKALSAFSKRFGLAFQTADDLDDAARERDPKTGTYPGTSVLHYLSFESAQKQASDELDESMRELQRLWPKSSQSLIEISRQLHRSLKATHP